MKDRNGVEIKRGNRVLFHSRITPNVERLGFIAAIRAGGPSDGAFVSATGSNCLTDENFWFELGSSEQIIRCPFPPDPVVIAAERAVVEAAETWASNDPQVSGKVGRLMDAVDALRQARKDAAK